LSLLWPSPYVCIWTWHQNSECNYLSFVLLAGGTLRIPIHLGWRQLVAGVANCLEGSTRSMWLNIVSQSFLELLSRMVDTD
jgi:hypothetical protein